MQSWDDIKARVNEAVDKTLLPAVFDLLERQHKNSGFKKSCPCSYCHAKRLATYQLQFIGPAAKLSLPTPVTQEIRDRFDSNYDMVRHFHREVIRKNLDVESKKIIAD